MTEDRIGAITQESIEVIILLNLDEIKLHFQTLMLCSSMRVRFCPRGMQRLPIQVTMSDPGA